MKKEIYTHSFGTSFSGLLQISFIILKLCGVIAWSWWLVLLPFFISWLVAVAVDILGMVRKSRTERLEYERDGLYVSRHTFNKGFKRGLMVGNSRRDYENNIRILLEDIRGAEDHLEGETAWFVGNTRIRLMASGTSEAECDAIFLETVLEIMEARGVIKPDFKSRLAWIKERQDLEEMRENKRLDELVEVDE